MNECPTCNGTHEIRQRFELDKFGLGHFTRTVREVVPCPDCRRCSACGRFVDENPMQPLHEWRPRVWWCEGECCSNWIFAQIEARNITLIDAQMLALVVRDVCSEDPDPDPGYAFDAQARLSEVVGRLGHEIAKQARPKETPNE